MLNAGFRLADTTCYFHSDLYHLVCLYQFFTYITRINMRGGLLGIFVFIWALSANASTVHLDQKTNWPLKLGSHALVFEDPSGELDLKQILALPASVSRSFVSATQHNLQSGYSRSAWWLEFKIRNDGAVPLSQRLVLGSNKIRRIDFYLEQNGIWTHSLVGDGIPLDAQARASRLPSLAFTLQAGEQVRILARSQSNKSFRLHPELYSASSYIEATQRNVLWDHLYFGAMIALSWCILAIALFARKLSLAIMGLLCANMLMYEFINRGYAKLYLWPEAGEWAYRSANVFGHAGIALYILTFYFLSRQEKIILPAPRYLLGIAALQGATALASAVGDHYIVNQAGVCINLLSGISLLALSIVMKKRAVPTGGLMLLTNTFVMIRLGMLAADRFGWLTHDASGPGIDDMARSPAMTLVGLTINLTLIAAWISHVGKQRQTARKALTSWQEQEQHRLETEVGRQTHALNQALQYANENNRKKTETLGYVSHDLRAPLVTIIGYAQLLSNTQTSAQKPHIQAIERSANYQLTLIDDLLEYTKQELQPLKVSPEPIAMADLMEDITQFALALSAQQDNRFQYDVRTPLPAMVVLDGRRLRQVLLNLLANAAKFTRHGTISLVVEAAPQADRWSLRFTVSDTGIGMHAEAQSRVFNAFTQLQPQQAGVGLGLFIAQQIVDAMGGKLLVESSPGMGSQFSFEISVACGDNMQRRLPAKSPIITPEQPLANPAQFATYPIPPAHIRVELAIHARDGQLTDIENWLHRMSKAYPAYPIFFSELQAALHTLDFEYIEALALSTET